MSTANTDTRGNGPASASPPTDTARAKPFYRPPQSPARIAISPSQMHSATAASSSPATTPRRHHQHSHSRKGSSGDTASGWRHTEEKQHSPRPQKPVPQPQLELGQYVPTLDQQMREPASATSSLAISALLTSLHHSLSASHAPHANGSSSAAAAALPASVDLPALLSCLHRLLTRGISLTLYHHHVNTAISPASSPTASSASSSRPPPGFDKWRSKTAVSAAHSLSPFAMPSLFSPPTTAPSPLSTASLAPSTSAIPPRHSLPSSLPSPASASSASPIDDQIRLSALSCLDLLALQHPRSFHPHTSLFLPSDLSSSLSPRPFAGSHLLTLVLFDPSAAVRAAAASVLASVVNLWWSSMKRGGGGGGGSGGGGAAVRQLDVVRGLHVGLLDAMQNERSGACVLALVKAAGTMAATVPYEQLLPPPTTSSSSAPVAPSPPLLSPIIDHLLTLLPPPAGQAVSRSVPSSPSSAMRSLSSPHSHSAELRSTIFSTLASLLDHKLLELDRHISSSSAASLSVIPALLFHAAGRSSSDSASDAFLPLSKLARHYPTTLANHWQPGSGLSLHAVLTSALARSSDGVGRLSALRLLEEWTKTDASQLSDELDDADEAGGGIKEPPNSAFFQLSGTLDMYGQQLPQLFHERTSGTGTPSTAAAGSQSAVRARVVTLLSFVPYSSWTSLSPTQQLQLMVCMREAAGDDASTVRTASCRCLSLYAVYCGRQQTNEARGFVSEGVQLLLEMMGDDERVLAVRARAAWSVANLCESSSAPSFVSHLSASLLHSLVSSILTACSIGNDKVVAHAIRAAGNVGRWLPLTASSTEQQWLQLVATTVSVLEVSKAVKSRWNACHAMGNLLRNPHLTTHPSPVLSSHSSSTLIPVLLRVLTHHLSPTAAVASSSSVNYKVSINAAGALSAPPSRVVYGSCYVVCVVQLLSYVTRCEQLDCKDYREVKYRDVLRGQLTLALLHVLCMLRSRADEEVEVVAAVEGGASVLARLVLMERMRLESEVNRARLSSVTRRATAAVSAAPAAATAAAAVSVSSVVPHADADVVETVAERVSAVLSEDVRERFVLGADGRPV